MEIAGNAVTLFGRWQLTRLLRRQSCCKGKQGGGKCEFHRSHTLVHICTSFERRVSQDEEGKGEQGERRSQIDQKGRRQTANGPHARTCWPAGGLFGIDQEVVTLRGLSRQLPGQGFNGSPRDESLRATYAMLASVITG